MAKKKEDTEEPQEGRDEKGRFIEGNFFSRGLDNSGAPPLYEDWRAMSQKIAEYIAEEDSLRATGYKKQGNGTYTIEGLALHLGFATRDSIYDYEKKSPEFSYILNRFRLFVTRWNVVKLYNGSTFMGAQFWLKNFGGYTDETTQHQKVENVRANFGTTLPTTSESGENP